MLGRAILLGTQSFRKLRENDNVYIDKTGFITEFLSGSGAKVSIITRPRRFGKSLLLNTLREFFDRTKDSREIFEGLAVSKDKELCAKWMNKYPVIYLYLNEIKSLSFDESYDILKLIAGKICAQYSYLLNSSKVGESYKIRINAMQTLNADEGMIYNFIRIICEAIYQDCGIKPIILIDEYDSPLSKIKGDEDYKKMSSFLGNFFEISLKSNRCFEFAILAGCLPITNAGITTGFNNYTLFGINDSQFADKFGFTQEEVQSLLAEKGCSDKMDKLQEWYDGYCFGNSHSIYCPWDVIQYLFDLEDNPDAAPKKYWIDTSGNDVVQHYLENYTEMVADEIASLLNHGCINARMQWGMSYKNLYDSEANVRTLLYLTGYLTKVPDIQQKSYGNVTLCIPNKEIFAFFTKTIESVFRRKIQGNDSLVPLLDVFYDAFWKREDKKVTKILSALFLNTSRSYDYEVLCQALLAGVFKAKYPWTTSNYEIGPGRADIIVEDWIHKRAAIIELKHADTKEGMDSSADDALRQIADMKYDAPLHSDYPVVLHWGIACCDKSCVTKSVAG